MAGAKPETDETLCSCSTESGGPDSGVDSPPSGKSPAAADTVDAACCEPEGVQIIIVGIMRTGQKRLHHALRTLGYPNMYTRDDIVSTYDLWHQVIHDEASDSTFAEIFDRREVIGGLPVFCFWEQIVDLYPNARVILTMRDEDEWLESVQECKSLMQKDMPGAPLSYGSSMLSLERFLVPSYHKFCDVLRFAWSSILGAHILQGEKLNEAMARSSYRKHNSYVRAVLESQTTPQGEPRLLVYNVKEGWDPLCRFLGKEPPQVEFPAVAVNWPPFPGGKSLSQSRCTQSFEEMLSPDSDFGIRMREELRWGLAKCGFILALLVSLVFSVFLVKAVEAPTTFVALGQVIIMMVGWNIYLVMHSLVLRVPALLVLPVAMKSLLIAGALQACFISYGILKEMLVTQDHIASPLLVLSSRFGAILCSAGYLLLTEGSVSLGAPMHALAAFAFTNEASTWAGYEMLNYVSFPVQVMAKSVKMLPSMIMGRVVNGTRYSMYQYLQASAALVCVCVMQWSDGGQEAGKASQRAGDADAMSFRAKLSMGILMLLIFFVCDSFTSQWQNALYRKHPKLTQTQMMLGGNLLGFLFTSGTLVAAWPKVQASIQVAMENPAIMGRILCLGVVYALGQFCIYSAIRILGPLSFTWIMTARQLLSVLISLVFFGHGISLVKVVCILVVFGIMSAKQLTKVVPEIGRRASELKRSISKRSFSSFSQSKISEHSTKSGDSVRCLTRARAVSLDCKKMR